MTASESLESRKDRMLKAGVFHFDSGRDNLQNLMAARELEAEGKGTGRHIACFILAPATPITQPSTPHNADETDR